MRYFLCFLAVCVVCALILLSSGNASAGAIPVGANVRVSDAGLSGNDASAIRTTEQDGTLYAVWEDDREGTFRSVYFAKSTNGGESWGPNILVSLLPYDEWINHPDIAVQPDGTIWVVWHIFYRDESEQLNDLRLAKSTDGGESFTVTTLLNGVAGDSDLWRARIVADESNGGLYIMSQLYDIEGSDEGSNLFLLRYVAATQSWEEAIINDVARAGRLSTSTQDYGANFSLTARNGIVCAAWEDRGRNLEERMPIYGACSSDGGATFGANFKISGDDGVRPEIALGPEGEFYAAYAVDTDSHNNIKLRLSTDQGTTWQPERPVTNIDAFEVRDWDLAVDANGQVVLTYVHELDIKSDLYLTTSVDQGLNFTYNILEDDQGEYAGVADQYGPSVAVGGAGESTHAYVAWEDDRNSENELWSARALLDGVPPTTPENVAVAPAERALRISWADATDVTGIAGYRVYRATSAAGPFSEISARLVMTTSYVDVELDGSTYFYHVAAVDGTGNTGLVSTNVSGVALTAGDPTFVGKLAYEAGESIRVRNLSGDPAERTLTDATQPRFALNGSTLYYRSLTSISSQPVDGGAPTIFFNAEGLAEYDLAENESYYAALIARSFAAPGVVGATCFVNEPHYGRPGQELYVTQNDYGSEVAISNDRKWLVYRTEGFCNVAGAGLYTPPRLCFVDLAAGEESCVEGYDYRTPDFAPSGHWLAFSVDFTGQEEVWKAQVQSDRTLSHYTQLSHGAANQPSRAPSWSSDGKWLVFQRDIDPSAQEDWRLYVVRNDGVGVRALDIAGERPAWSGGDSGETPNPTGEEMLYLPNLTRQ